jgi:hypothetical protein
MLPTSENASRCGRWLTAANAASERAPDFLGALQLCRERAFGGREDDLAAAVELGIGVLHARDFAPGDGVRGHEGTDLRLQRVARRLHHVGLGGADVHDEHLRRDEVAYGLERGLGGRHRHRDEHDVGPGDGQQRGRRLDVDHAELARALGRRGRLAVADHALDQAGLFQRQRERAAHQAAADQAELFKHGHASWRRGAPAW